MVSADITSSKIVEKTAEPAVAAACDHYIAGRIDEAELAAKDCLRKHPLNHPAMQVMGYVARTRGQIDAAIGWFRQAIAVEPLPAYHTTIACLLELKGANKLAENAFREVVRLRPEQGASHRNLALFLAAHNQADEALAEHLKAVSLDPKLTASHCDAGQVLRAMGRLDEALKLFQEALTGDPESFEARVGIAGVLNDQGRLFELIDVSKELVDRKPDDAALHSNLLFALHYDPRQSPLDLFDEAIRFGQRHGNTEIVPAHTNDPTPTRRIRIGYISPDFREHVVARLIRPVLAMRDRDQFEVICYSDVRWTDSVTHEIWLHSDKWRCIVDMSDSAVADLIRHDGVDILVELAGHFGGNRLSMLARKPAPVQVTHFGYCDTTGLRAVDYRITDAYSDPPGETEQFHTEELWRLPGNSWCYRPPETTPDVGPLPATKVGHITFSSLNSVVKVTEPLVQAWARILDAVPRARLMMLSGGAGDGYTRRRFEHLGIPSERLELVRRRPRFQYLELHNQIDIGLDPFPFNGDNTTCDALWMGVPVVSLEGRIFCGRRGLSHLKNIALGELCVSTVQEYVRLAVALATDLPRLQALRLSLRSRMESSTLGNVTFFTRNLEAAYRAMWEQWCKRQMFAADRTFVNSQHNIQ